MKTQLIQLSTLLRLLDVAFWNYLGVECSSSSTCQAGGSSLALLIASSNILFSSSAESQDSGYLYFCFRWLLIRFKRELGFQDVLRLWEVGLLFHGSLTSNI